MRLNNEKKSDYVLFREVQRTDRAIIYLLIFISSFAAIVFFILKYFYILDSSMIIFFLPFGILFLFFRSKKLVTEVREGGIYVCSYPLGFSKFVPFGNIQSYNIRIFDPNDPHIHRYLDPVYEDVPCPGGVHYCVGPASKGMVIEFTEGMNVKKILIGTQIPEKLTDAIKKGIEKQTSF
jgi:hypothetical protein